ncbi:MAG: PAS domain S-box protein [Actinomycetota bacterium]
MIDGDSHIEQRVRAHTLFHLNPDAVFCLSPSGEVVDVNEAAAKVAGRPRDEMIGAHFSEFFGPEQLPLAAETFTQVAGGEGVTHQTLSITRPDGTEVALDVSAFPSVVDARLVGIYGIARDVTERVREREELRLSAAALRESENLVRQLIDNIGGVFYLADPGMKPVFVSPQYEEVWGQTVEEALSRPSAWLEVIHPDDRARVVETIDGASRFDVEYRLVRSDGSIRWIRDKGFPVTDEAGQVIRIAGIAEDVTSQKLLEDQLRQAQKMESVGQLAGGVAHDFNNLLLVIMSAARFLEEDMPDEDPGREDIRLIVDAAERGASLVRHLLAFSRRQIVNPKVLNVNDVIDEVEPLLRRSVGERVEFLLNRAPDLAMTKIDPNQLGHVLMNLVVNAGNSMPQGGTLSIDTGNVVISDEVDQTLERVPAGSYVCISVSDTGHGIERENLDRIFEPFFSTRNKAEATGLGLSMAYGIVSQAGGRISVYSEPRIGSTFKIYLPAVEQIPEDTPVRRPPGKKRDQVVLVAEDDATVSAAVANMLRREGFRVLHAPTGSAALEICRSSEERIDVVLTDVVMPGMSGRELGVHVQATRPETAVIYMSGYSEDMIGRHGILQADDNYLQKPFTSADLVGKIDQVLRKR